MLILINFIEFVSVIAVVELDVKELFIQIKI